MTKKEWKDVFDATAFMLDRLSHGQKEAVIALSTDDFKGAKKLTFSHAGHWRSLTYGAYKTPRGAILRLCRDWLIDNFGTMRRTLYVKIMWM